MYTSVIVPLDTSVQAERALPLAESVARRCDAPVRLVTFVPADWAVPDEEGYLRKLAAGLDVPTTVEVRDRPGWTIDDLAAHIEEDPGALVCMTSFGRGRTGALLGSVAEGLLRRERGPALLVGPRCERFDIVDGDPIAIAVDGSPAADEVIGLGGSWAITFGLTPWIVTCVDRGRAPDGSGPDDERLPESAALHGFADRLGRDIGREVEWEVLHGRHHAERLASFAADADAAVIAMGTRGTTGLRRLAVGSVCAATVHRAPCPVLVHRTVG
jgi:nucleotide-binding universal stress UspA family protein